MKIAKTLKPLVIDRATWLNGTVLKNVNRGVEGKVYASSLLSTHVPIKGMMCCLGSLAIACGATAKSIAGVATVSSARANKLGINFLFAAPSSIRKSFGDDRVQDTFIGINDDDLLLNSERERKLKALFRKHGWAVTFTGKYPHVTQS